MPAAQAWRTLRYSSTLKILAPSLLSQKGKGWTTFTPPAAAPCRRFRGLISHRRSHANGQRPLLHEGADDGHIAGLNATSENPIHLSRRIPLSVVFSDPQIASVGQRAGELNPRTILTGEVSFARQGRARTMQENYGLLRLYAARENGRLLGAEMVAPAAEHMGHLLALAIGQKLTVHDLLRMPFYHPTLEEGLRTALRMIARELPPCSISDLAGCGPIGVEALE